MNIYAIFILIVLLSEYILNLFAEYLNLQTLSIPLPNEFENVYDASTYIKSQEYTRVRTRFGIIESSFSILATLLFWFFGGFNSLDELIRRWGFGILFSGLLYIGMLAVLRSILSLPFSIYSTFVIEERFGFNKTTFATYVWDIIKGLLLAVILGGPLLLGILAFFQYSGSLAWFYCWVIASSFILFVQFIAPTWIMPLFNKFTPLETGELRSAIIAYVHSVDFSLRDVYIMDGSKRSSKSNAFFTGFGKNKRITLFDTLIQKQTVPELISVLAHEIGHYKKKHIIQGIIISIVHIGLMFFLMSIFINQKGLYDAFYMNNISIYAGVLLFGLLYTPIEFLISLVLNALSRKNEYEADRFASLTIDSPETLAVALKKLSLDNLSHLTPHPFYVKLNYSHPPVLKRIEMIRAIQRRKIA